MRFVIFLTLACLSACGWFGAKRHPASEPSELIVTGAPAGTFVFVDGAKTGPATAAGDHAHVVRVAPGSHQVEIHRGDVTVYREDTDVAPGEHRVVTVLSGAYQ